MGTTVCQECGLVFADTREYEKHLPHKEKTTVFTEAITYLSQTKPAQWLFGREGYTPLKKKTTEN